MTFWRFKAPKIQQPAPRPIKAEGREARERTERDVERAREDRQKEAPMLAWLRRDYERNHYADALADLFRGQA